MTVVTAKELKNQTGRVLQRVRQGEEVIITVRGVPVARFIPIESSVKVSKQKRQARLQAVEECFGKYKGIISVEEYLRLKAEEIALEEGGF